MISDSGKKRDNIQHIKLLAMDVDGTLTDGKVHISSAGELYKSFDIKDGYGIKNLLPTAGIVPAIVTGRDSIIVESRARELGVADIFQNVTDKAAAIRELAESYGFRMKEAAFIGDDLSDLPAMKICGVSACPADAAAAVKAAADYICKRNGGDGAVREFIEWLIGLDK